jgi:hypothetical protein
VSFAGLAGSALLGLAALLSAGLPAGLAPGLLPETPLFPQAASEKAITQHSKIAMRDFNDFFILFYSFYLSF